MSEAKDMSGFLMRDDKRSNERAPEFTGKAVVFGKELRVAAWVKESKGGKKYFSLAFEEPRDKPPTLPTNGIDIPF